MTILSYLYELDVHINRFFRSTSKDRIVSPFTFSELKSILIQLSAASKCRKGTLRYWLSAGPENLLLSPAKCLTSAFYVMVIDEDFAQCKEGKWQRPSTDRTCKNHFKHNLHFQATSRPQSISSNQAASHSTSLRQAESQPEPFKKRVVG
ncbi:hypothetical protein RDI58_013105 [Solanum bulbocastanum]|uniref:Uncharacterized protein n=1 Tax=Solanum bulbocastanum TaxID=147425 RepID=A0AAN8TSY9_SOLBU